MPKVICEIPVAGIQPITTIDFPGKIAAVLFTQGCPWECRYCHNPALGDMAGDHLVSCEEIETFLRNRVHFLDGIVISGGEPTLHAALPEFLASIKDLGYATAIHTNGYYPERLRRILKKGLTDYVAMDVKAPPRVYDRITGVADSTIEVARSIDLVMASGIEYEFRTTYHPALLTEDELLEIVRVMTGIGVKRYYIQRFRNVGVCDPELSDTGDVIEIPDTVIREAEKCIPEFGVR